MIQLEFQIMCLKQRYPLIDDSPVKVAFIHACNLPPVDQVSQQD